MLSNVSNKIAILKPPTFHSQRSKSKTVSYLEPSNDPSKIHHRVTYNSNNYVNQSQGENQIIDKYEKQDEPKLIIDGDINIINRTENNEDILCVCYTETFDYIAAGLPDGAIKMMNVNNENFEFTLHDNEMVHNPGFTTAIKHRCVQTNYPITQTLTATYATGCVKCWHYPTGRCLYTIRENRETLGLSYHPRLPKFITVGDDAILNLYDEETRTHERIFHCSTASPGKINDHKSRVLAACFHPKSNHELISSGWDEIIQFWDTREACSTRQIMGGRICGDSLDISTNGKEILTCNWSKENSIQLWDYGSGKCIVTIEPDIWSSNLHTGKYISKLFIACGGYDENIFRIVDLRSHSTVAFIKNLSNGIRAMDVGKNSKYSRHSGIPQLPKIVFCCGKSIFQIQKNK